MILCLVVLPRPLFSFRHGKSEEYVCTNLGVALDVTGQAPFASVGGDVRSLVFREC